MFSLLKTKSSFLLILILGQYALAQNIILTPSNTDLKFEIKHLKVLSVQGTFDDFKGKLIIKKDSLFLSGSIQVESINTNNVSRDETLRSKPYFDAEQYAEIFFEGSGSKKQERFFMEGTLTLKGKNTETTFELLRDEKFLKSDELIISRKNAGLNFDSMDQLIGDKVKVIFRIKTQ